MKQIIINFHHFSLFIMKIFLITRLEMLVLVLINPYILCSKQKITVFGNKSDNCKRILTLEMILGFVG